MAPMLNPTDSHLPRRDHHALLRSVTYRYCTGPESIPGSVGAWKPGLWARDWRPLRRAGACWSLLVRVRYLPLCLLISFGSCLLFVSVTYRFACWFLFARVFCSCPLLTVELAGFFFVRVVSGFYRGRKVHVVYSSLSFSSAIFPPLLLPFTLVESVFLTFLYFFQNRVYL